MKTATVHFAKTNLSKLIEQVLAGEEVTITRGATPVVKIVALEPPALPREPGAMKGMFRVGPEFFEPLSDDELSGWGE